eukprot:4605580-Amphidinium_carterae.1
MHVNVNWVGVVVILDVCADVVWKITVSAVSCAVFLIIFDTVIREKALLELAMTFGQTLCAFVVGLSSCVVDSTSSDVTEFSPTARRLQ